MCVVCQRVAVCLCVFMCMFLCMFVCVGVCVIVCHCVRRSLAVIVYVITCDIKGIGQYSPFTYRFQTLHIPRY